MTTVTIQATLEQAHTIKFALDTYARLCIGQLEEVACLVSDGTIPVGGLDSGSPRRTAGREEVDLIDAKMRECKQVLGYSSNGSNGIGNRHVHESGHRAWEVKKTLERALSMHRDPNPAFPTVDYDGRVVRYTSDPDAVVDVTP